MECVQNSVKKPCEKTIFECPRNMCGDDIKKNLKEIECDHEMNGTDSGACPMMGFVNIGVEPSCSTSLGSFPVAGFGIISVELLDSAAV
jgi:hypothetical protein